MDNIKNLGALKIMYLNYMNFINSKYNTNYFARILMNNTIDIFIDYGFHSDESIIITTEGQCVKYY